MGSITVPVNYSPGSPIERAHLRREANITPSCRLRRMQYSAVAAGIALLAFFDPPAFPAVTPSRTERTERSTPNAAVNRCLRGRRYEDDLVRHTHRCADARHLATGSGAGRENVDHRHAEDHEPGAQGDCHGSDREHLRAKAGRLHYLHEERAHGVVLRVQ